MVEKPSSSTKLSSTGLSCFVWLWRFICVTFAQIVRYNLGRVCWLCGGTPAQQLPSDKWRQVVLNASHTGALRCTSHQTLPRIIQSDLQSLMARACMCYSGIGLCPTWEECRGYLVFGITSHMRRIKLVSYLSWQDLLSVEEKYFRVLCSSDCLQGRHKCIWSLHLRRFGWPGWVSRWAGELQNWKQLQGRSRVSCCNVHQILAFGTPLAWNGSVVLIVQGAVIDLQGALSNFF